jgi:DNA invertase Pin-like site-specific DNA recombinase
MDAAAAYERSIIRARTKAALGVKKARGEYVGNPPFGFEVGQDGKTLRVNQREASIAAELRQMRAANLSYRQIQQQSAERGLLNRANARFSLKTLFSILGKPKAEGASIRYNP